MSALPEKYRDIKDPAERAKALTEYIERGELALMEARKQRVDDVTKLRKDGMTWSAIKELVGVTEQYMRREMAKRTRGET